MRPMLLVISALPFLAGGCEFLFGLSPGEFDSDPFGRDAGDGPYDSGSDSSRIACSPLIDDLDDGNMSIISCEGRRGDWYAYNDNSIGGKQTPAPGAAFVPDGPGYGGSAHAAHVVGHGFTRAGSGIGLTLNVTTNGRGAYNASAYTGIRFFAKHGGNDRFRIYLHVRDKSRDLQGGVCNNNCADLFGVGVNLYDDWVEYKESFDSLLPDSTPAGATVDQAHLYAIEFHVLPNRSYDFWVDGVGFY